MTPSPSSPFHSGVKSSAEAVISHATDLQMCRLIQLTTKQVKLERVGPARSILSFRATSSPRSSTSDVCLSGGRENPDLKSLQPPSRIGGSSVLSWPSRLEKRLNDLSSKTYLLCASSQMSVFAFWPFLHNSWTLK